MQGIDADLWHCFKRTGERKTNKDTGLPKLNQAKLLERFALFAADHQLKVPTTKTGKLTTSVNEFWSQYRDLDPLVDAYCRYAEQTKLRKFFGGLEKPRIYPKYRTMVRTGRTSCSAPNIQQLPTKSPIRETIVASPGHLFFQIDYNSLELRTLAAICHERFGFSKLREVLIKGIDPHSYTAAMFADVSLEQFNELPNKKQLRQRAKVFNFGLPAGFGANALVDHAKFSYGVELTLDEAKHFIAMVTHDVYPELGPYLTEDVSGIIAYALKTDIEKVKAAWPEPYGPGMLGKVIKDEAVTRDGTPYQTSTINQVWRQLSELCDNPELHDAIEQRNTKPCSPLRKLFFSPVSTSTGRFRGGVPFTAKRNTPFQGLAADGCKQAMWNLTKAGYCIVAFIHDEFIIELCDDVDFDAEAAIIASICSDSMQPFVPGIPVPCEFALTERWHKGAEAVYDEAGRLQVWCPA